MILTIIFLMITASVSAVNYTITTPYDANEIWDIQYAQYDNKMYHPAVTWTVVTSQAGAIGVSGLFTAGVQAGTYTDAIVVGNGVLTETASVTVYWPYQVYLPLVLKED